METTGYSNPHPCSDKFLSCLLRLTRHVGAEDDDDDTVTPKFPNLASVILQSRQNSNLAVRAPIIFTCPILA